MKSLLLFTFYLVFFSSCDVNKMDIAIASKDSLNGRDTAENSKASLLHQIAIEQSGGLSIKQAYLIFENGRLLPKTHRITSGDTVLLKLSIDKGWTVKEGRVSIDAAQTITTSQDEVILNAPNLFDQQSTISEKEAEHIVLKAVITQTNKEVKFFTVAFRLWDCWGSGEVKGSYRLYITDDAN